MVLWSNSDKTCKTSADVIFISPISSGQNSAGCSCILWKIPIAVILIVKLMTCYGEFRILYGASLLILDCWLPFPYTDVIMWRLNKVGRLMSGAAILDNCQIYWLHMYMFPIWTNHRFHFSVTREISTSRSVWHEGMENTEIYKKTAGKESKHSGKLRPCLVHLKN